MTRGGANRLAATLRSAGVETPELDGRVLALDAFRLDHAALLARLDEAAPGADLGALQTSLRRRMAGEPVARIVGRREFWGLEFVLSPDTLVPRPDTEIVVQTALDLTRDVARPLTILDLGTGSGCILLALLSERHDAIGLGVDRSPAAAATARVNAEALGLAARALFVVGDWGTAAGGGRFDLVVSNPPYVQAADIAYLDVAVRDHDPRLALDGGFHGLDAYEAILDDARRLLAPDGLLVFELGAGQLPDVERLGAQRGFAVEGVRPDLSGVARALAFRVPD